MSDIAKKLADIAARMEKPQKSGELEYAGHKYSTRDDLVDVLREELSSRDVAVIPSTEIHSHTLSNKGGWAVVEVELTFVDGESGEKLTSSWCGESKMSGDKAVASAATQAVRFCLINTFLVSDGMVEAVNGNTSSAGGREQNQNVHRQKKYDDPREALAERLKDLGLSGRQVTAFERFVADRMDASDYSAVADHKVQKWAARLEKCDDETAADKVHQAISDDAA